MYKLRFLFLFIASAWLTACGGGNSKGGSESAAENNTAAGAAETPAPGVALYSFNKYPLPEALDMAKEAGASQVEGFSFHDLGPEFSNPVTALQAGEVEKIKRLLDERGLRMPSMYADAKDLNQWQSLFETGKKLGLDFFVAEPEPAMWDALDSLAGAYGIKIAIHQHARGLSRYWHPDSVLAALEGHPNFGACGDLGHWTRSGLDPVTCLSRLEGQLISIHAKDLDRAAKDAQDVRISEGVIDYPAVYAELKRQQFEGPVYVECEHDFENNIDDVKSGLQYLGRL